MVTKRCKRNRDLHSAFVSLQHWNVTSARWQVTLCDPTWHVSSRSGVATLRTAIHLLLTYLLNSVFPIDKSLTTTHSDLLAFDRDEREINSSKGEIDARHLLERLHDPADAAGSETSAGQIQLHQST